MAADYLCGLISKHCGLLLLNGGSAKKKIQDLVSIFCQHVQNGHYLYKSYREHVSVNHTVTWGWVFSKSRLTIFILFSDDDVLDTWFSSGIFPFSIFGYPEKVNQSSNMNI